MKKLPLVLVAVALGLGIARQASHTHLPSKSLEARTMTVSREPAGIGTGTAHYSTNLNGGQTIEVFSGYSGQEGKLGYSGEFSEIVKYDTNGDGKTDTIIFQDPLKQRQLYTFTGLGNSGSVVSDNGSVTTLNRTTDYAANKTVFDEADHELAIMKTRN